MNTPSFEAQQLFARGTVRRHCPLSEVIDRLRVALKSFARGDAQMPAKNYLYFESSGGDLRTMSSYVPEFDLATVKIVNAHPNNPDQHHLPTVMALLVAVDPETGYPRAVMDATEITAVRTAAVSAVATDLLAPPDAHTLGIIGAGAQAPYQIQGQLIVRPIDRVYLYDISPDHARELARRVREDYPDLEVEVLERAEGLLEHCRIITSTTPSTRPVIEFDELPDSLHVNAMGADAPGKQEWPEKLVKRSRVVIDDWSQASHSGEINKLVTRGELSRDDVLGSLGELLVDPPEGPLDRTLFDSTGLAIQDTTAASVLLSQNPEPDGRFSFFD